MDYLHLIIFFFVNSIFYIFLYLINRQEKREIENHCEDLLAEAQEEIDELNKKNEELQKEIEKIKLEKPKQESYEVKDLLSDLMTGEALVKVSRVSPDNVFIRSVKEQKGKQ